MLTHWLFVAVLVSANGGVNQAALFTENEYHCRARAAVYGAGPKFEGELFRFAMCIEPMMPSGLAEAPVPSR